MSAGHLRVGALPADPFPTEQLTPLLKRLPAYARLTWRLAREPGLSRGRRAVLLAGAAYLASPIDLVPGVIPLAGQLDDAAAVLLAIRTALRGLPAEVREAHLAATGLSTTVLDDDLRTVGRLAAWLARRGARLAWRAARATGRRAGRLTGRLAATALRRLL